MKVISIVSRKGGVGKSTLATNFATSVRKSVILDTDPQATCSDWGDRRPKKNPEIITVPPRRVGSITRNLVESWGFVDTQPSAEISLIEVARCSDLCIIVICPYQFELDALGETVSILKAANANAVFCINRAQPRQNVSALENILKDDYPVGPVLRERTEYRAAAAKGLGVTEINTNCKASNELKTYMKWVKTWLN